MKMLLKPIAVLLLFAVCFLSVFSISVAGENNESSATEFEFIEQPVGGTANNREYFEFSWKTNIDCRVMLESREDETHDWGSIDYIESPYRMESTNYSAEYRLRAFVNDDEYYSNPFRITWKPADNLTTVEIADIDFGEVPLGYLEAPSYNVTITNTGNYDLENVEAYLAESSYLELIHNNPYVALKPGETDTVSFSVRPKVGLGSGNYSDSVFIRASNIDEVVYNTCTLTIGEPHGPVQYGLEARDIDFGLLTFSDGWEEFLVVSATGSGNLTNVHVKVDGADTFFRLIANNYQLDTLNAGMTSENNWYVRLNPDLPDGEYSATIYVYAKELDNPVPVTISAVVREEEVDHMSYEPDTSSEPHNDTDNVPNTSDAAGKSKDGNNKIEIYLVLIIEGGIIILLVVGLIIVHFAKKERK